ARGITVANDGAQVATSSLMVTAHGASARTLASTRALGLNVVEATCPLVHVAHRAVATLVRDGYHVVIIGQRDHVEVRHLAASIQRRFPRSDVRFLDTVCKPTKERQQAAVELARASDGVIVIGG